MPLTGNRRPALVLAAASALIGLVMMPAVAAPGWDVRPYVGLRLGVQGFADPEIAPGVQASSLLDAYGVSVGLDLGPHLGLEVAGDHFEPVLRDAARHSIGELGVFAAIPQLRLRYPLPGARLVPYVVGGLGVAVSDFNDRKRRGFGRSVHASNAGLAWSLGGGVEYSIADNVGLGVEGRALLISGHEIEVDGRQTGADLDSFVVSGVLRVHFSESRPAAAPTPRPWWTPSLTFRAGVASVLHRQVARGLEIRTEHAAVGPGLDQAYGATVGVDLTRFLAVEVAGDGYEVNLAVPGRGLVGEYGVSAVIPQLRARWPLLDGRLAPSATAGVGVSYAQFNDRKPHGAGLDVESNRFGVVAAVGVGVEFLVARNAGLGLDIRYLRARGHDLHLAVHGHGADLESLVTTFGVRVLFR